jgi:hypothetical protein
VQVADFDPGRRYRAARDNDVMIVRADVAGRVADRVWFGASAIVDAGRAVRTAAALSEDLLVAELHAGGQESAS